MHLKLDLVLQFGRFPEVAAHRKLLRKSVVTSWIEPALRHPAEIAVRIVGQDEGRALNLQYRGRDYATNVLTFEYSHDAWVEADLVLCGPIVEREAGRCTRRATTTRPARRMRWRWRRWRSCCSGRSGIATRTSGGGVPVGYPTLRVAQTPA
jgi:hypothetical protein